MNAFDIEITGERGMLRFTLIGPGTHPRLLRAVASIVSETKSRGIWHVLCDATGLISPIGAFEKFEAGVELSRGADRRMKMAVVQNVAGNHGGCVAVFRNEGAALQWLQSPKIGERAD